MRLLIPFVGRHDPFGVAVEEEVTKPDKPIARWYLLGDADYPANQQELLFTAQNNGAPRAFVERLRNLAMYAEFSGVGEVAQVLEPRDQSYEEQASSRRGAL